MEKDEFQLEPLVDRKRKQYGKKGKEKLDQTQRIGRVSRKQQVNEARLRDYEEDMEGY